MSILQDSARKVIDLTKSFFFPEDMNADSDSFLKKNCI